MSQGATPGTIIQAGPGVLMLNGNVTYAANMSVTGGTLSLSPPSGATSIISGLLNVNGGVLSISGAGTVALANANLSGLPATINVQSGTLAFAPPGSSVVTYSGVLAGNGAVAINGTGAVVLTGNNSYSGPTTVSGGRAPGDRRGGIAHGQFPQPRRRSLQSNGTATVTFSRSLGTGGSGALSVDGQRRRFCRRFRGNECEHRRRNIADMGKLVSREPDRRAARCLGSTTAGNVVTLQNRIDLGGADITIRVMDNPATAADFAVVSGTISNVSGTAGIVKTDAGLLKLTATDSYNGAEHGLRRGPTGKQRGRTAQRQLSQPRWRRAVKQQRRDFLARSGTSRSAFSMDGQWRRLRRGRGGVDRQPRRRQRDAELGNRRGQRDHGDFEVRFADRRLPDRLCQSHRSRYGRATIEVDDSAASPGADYAVLSGTLSGSAGLTLQGSGVLNPTAANTYTGVATLTGGTLRVGSISNGGVAGPLGAATADPANLVFNGGTLQYTGSTATTDRSFTMAGNATINTTNALTFSSQIATPNPTAVLTKTGSGSLTFSNALNDFALGGLVAQQGTLNFRSRCDHRQRPDRHRHRGQCRFASIHRLPSS